MTNDLKQLWKTEKRKVIFKRTMMHIENSQLLRFSTAGSVDDGKSTLIGRLLFDSKSIFEDQLDSIEKTSRRRGHEGVDLALFTDGLRDEREQGITIDVAYRYFTTPKRKFILADTPGHIQYTRNMITGASTANVALILIDARHGVVEQTKRHSYIASLLQIPHVIVCVNKMDLVDWQESQFQRIVAEYEAILSKMSIRDIHFIPMSALKGDNVVNRSENMPWYEGAPLLHTLENMSICSDLNMTDARFPVQTVIRPQSEQFPDYRGYAGRIESGIFRKGDQVIALPSGLTSKIKTIDTFNSQLEEAFAPMSVSIILEDDIDISRGDMLTHTNNQPAVNQELDATLCWLHSIPAKPRGKYIVKHTTNEQKAMLTEVIYKVNIHTLEHETGSIEIGMNDICRVRIKTMKPLFTDTFNGNRATGSFILIDEATHETVAAGMII